jgi:hypothetical protein
LVAEATYIVIEIIRKRLDELLFGTVPAAPCDHGFQRAAIRGAH